MKTKPQPVPYCWLSGAATRLSYFSPFFQVPKALHKSAENTLKYLSQYEKKEQESFKYLTEVDGLDSPNPNVLCRHMSSQRKESLSHQLHQSQSPANGISERCVNRNDTCIHLPTAELLITLKQPVASVTKIPRLP